ncbi:unnamed protein product, partial [Allacma fusca]
GESLSPTLFNIFINGIIASLDSSFTSPIKIGERHVHALLYADDVVILALSAESLQRKIDVVKKFFAQNKLTLNSVKSQIVVFQRPGGKPKKHTFFWGKSKLEGKAAIGALWPLLVKAKLPLSTAHFSLFNSMVRSVVTYGA